MPQTKLEAILASLAEKRAAKQRKGAAGAGAAEVAGAAAGLEAATCAKAKRKVPGVHAEPASRSGMPDAAAVEEPISSAELARAGLDGWTRKLSKTSGKYYYTSPGVSRSCPGLPASIPPHLCYCTCAPFTHNVQTPM